MGRLRLENVSLHECTGHRQKARSVAWNSTGARLASASIDRLAKIWSVDGAGQGREITNLAGHNAAVERVRWHPVDPNILCTAATDRTVLLWDARLPSSSPPPSSSGIPSPKYISKIDLISNARYGVCPASVEWHPDGSALVVAEKDNAVHVYDMRTLSTNRSRYSNTNSTFNAPWKPMITYRLRNDVVQECHFSPRGSHLFAATKASDGMGTVRIWRVGQENKTTVGGDMANKSQQQKHTVMVGHTGPIFCLRFSPCGKRLATGGFDALVGLWDTSEMVCTHTIGRLTKFVRSVSFSHDSKLLASSSEESIIDVADAETGEKVGEIQARDGADEMAWNPKCYALAFASGDPAEQQNLNMLSRNTPTPAHVTVVKMSVTS